MASVLFTDPLFSLIHSLLLNAIWLLKLCLWNVNKWRSKWGWVDFQFYKFDLVLELKSFKFNAAQFNGLSSVVNENILLHLAS